MAKKSIASQQKYTRASILFIVAIAPACTKGVMANESIDTKHAVESSIEMTASRQSSLDNDSVSTAYDDSIEFSIDLSWTYDWNDNYTISTSLLHESNSNKEASESLWEDEWSAELSELYIQYMPDFAPSHGVIVGRQSIADDPQWLDMTVDGLTLRGESSENSYVFGVGKPSSDITSEKDLRDPAADSVYWLYSSATILVTENSYLTGFVLREVDRSTLPEVGELVDGDNVDQTDRTLLWHGFTLGHESISSPIGSLSAMVNGSFVSGNELTLVLDDVELEQPNDESDLQSVASISNVLVSGWAIDTSLTLEIPRGNGPEITVGYAMGSGTKGWQPETSGSYRQSGTLTYGELYSPELTNIIITSLGLNSPINETVSIQLSHHRFKKRNANDDIGEIGIDLDQPASESRDLGSETSLSLNFDFNDSLNAYLTVSEFIPGSAYELQSETLESVSLGVSFDF